MWGIVTQVSTGLTLAAFLAAVSLVAYRAYLSGRARLMQSLPSEDRADQLKRELNAFGIDARNLTKDQQFTLALKEMELRRARISAFIVFATIVAVLAGVLALLSPRQATQGITPAGPANQARQPDAKPSAEPTIKPQTAATAGRGDPRPASEPRHSPRPAADAVTWEKNYDAMRRTSSGMGSSAPNDCGYRYWTRRETLVSALNALDLKSAPEIAATRDKLLVAVNNMPARCGSDDHYNLAMSQDMQDLRNELLAAIRAKVIENQGRLPD